MRRSPPSRYAAPSWGCFILRVEVRGRAIAADVVGVRTCRLFTSSLSHAYVHVGAVEGLIAAGEATMCVYLLGERPSEVARDGSCQRVQTHSRGQNTRMLRP